MSDLFPDFCGVFLLVLMTTSERWISMGDGVSGMLQHTLLVQQVHEGPPTNMVEDEDTSKAYLNTSMTTQVKVKF